MFSYPLQKPVVDGDYSVPDANIGFHAHQLDDSIR